MTASELIGPELILAKQIIAIIETIAKDAKVVFPNFDPQI